LEKRLQASLTVFTLQPFQTFTMPPHSPTAHFYDTVFARAEKDQQESFLRQLFERDASLCASFWAFINPLPQSSIVEVEALSAEIAKMQEKTLHYPWDILFEMDPVADEYSSELTDLIDREIIGPYQLKMEVACRTGDLCSALSYLRIIEKGTNVDWENAEEPGSHHIAEVKEHICYQFDFLRNCFLDYIFSVDAVSQAIIQAKTYQADANGFFDYSANWGEVSEILEDWLAKAKQL
jgi:hypothetical protein